MRCHGPCPSPEMVTRAALSTASYPEVLHHISRCDRCAAALQETQHLIALGKQLPENAPSEARAEQLLNRILSEDNGATRISTRWRRIAIAALLLLVPAGWILLGPPQKKQNETVKPGPAVAPVSVYRGTLHPQPGAVYAVLSGQPDEIVRLTHGTLTVQVDALLKDERFRVITGDAETEVRGTAFDISAESDHLTHVRVISGHVEVRPQEGPVTLLGPDESWPPRRSPQPAPTAPPPLPRTASGPKASTSAAHPEVDDTDASHLRKENDIRRPATDPAEQPFNDGWQALKSGNLKVAVRHFQKSHAAAPSSGFAEDALFFEAVARERQGDVRGAARTLALFIDNYPNSRRRGEAQAMLGWNLLRRNKADPARELFEAAVADPTPRIRKSAQKGLDTLDTAKE